jgi:hypothetical protein
LTEKGYTSCIKCGEKIELRNFFNPNPDYSSPNTYLPFLQWFWKEKREMWASFLEWAYIRELKPAFNNSWKTSMFISWLFSATGNNSHIMVLLSEWLSLPETRKIWGWEECPEYEPFCVPVCSTPCICKNGRIKAEWAKEG